MPEPDGSVWRNPAVIGGLIAAVATVVTAIITGMFGLLDNEDEPGPAEGAKECIVSGAIYYQEGNVPAPGIDVGAVPSASGFDDEEQFRFLTATSPQGTFSFPCSTVPDASPQVIALRSPGWGGCIHVTQYELSSVGSVDGVNLTVSDGAMSTLGDLWGIPKNDNCEFIA